MSIKAVVVAVGVVTGASACVENVDVDTEVNDGTASSGETPYYACYQYSGYTADTTTAWSATAGRGGPFGGRMANVRLRQNHQYSVDVAAGYTGDVWATAQRVRSYCGNGSSQPCLSQTGPVYNPEGWTSNGGSFTAPYNPSSGRSYTCRTAINVRAAQC